MNFVAVDDLTEEFWWGVVDFPIVSQEQYWQVKAALFRNKRFARNKIFQRNASKFAIFYVLENTNRFFRFSFHETLYFYLMNALVYVDIDQDIHKVKI